MGRRPPHRRLRLLAWLGALLLALSGCSAGSQAAPGTLADHLNAALEARSSSEFLDNFTADASGTALGTAWFTVLSKGETTFTHADDTTLEVTTSLPGDRRAATWTLRLQLEGRSPFTTGRIHALDPTPDRPIWALGPVEISTTTHGTLISSGLDAAARQLWTERIDRAAAAVARSALPGDAGWQGGLVVDVPATVSDFQAITDELANTASALTTCSTGTSRVVVNPLELDQSTEWLDSTLVHEAVHVATDSACVEYGHSLNWAAEGLAESVTARNDRATASGNRELVRTYLRDHPVPKALPSELSDLTDYALAQLAVDQLREHLGKAADELLDRAIHQAGSVTPTEVRRVTRWYTAELTRLSRSG